MRRPYVWAKVGGVAAFTLEAAQPPISETVPIAIQTERQRTEALVDYALAFLEEARAGLAIARELPGEASPDRLPEVLGRLRDHATEGDVRRRTNREMGKISV